jgi:catechol 2,3-dioxygenase-like lactoylglutathione lyase family enzyme
MTDKSMSLDHVGWVTNNIEMFERFWVEGLGFCKIWEAVLPSEKISTLFGIHQKAKVYRYDNGQIRLEAHVFDPPVETDTRPFGQFGINHISLYVSNREKFIHDLEEKVGYVIVRRFHDPGGWDNIFIRDFDGNWIELREYL